MVSVPKTMRSLIAPRKCTPASYEIRTIPTPRITQPTEVLIKVHTAGIFSGDIQIANNELPMFYQPPYPFSLSSEGSGTIIEAGPGVKDLKVGDAVYGLDEEKPMFRNDPTAFASEYAVVKENLLLRKPANRSFEDASALVGNTITAYQIIRRGLQRMGCESLDGKMVFIPAGLSATGTMAIQVARNVFGASKIITTVSTEKLALVEEHLPGMVDQIIDYKTERLSDRIPKGSVDLMINTKFSTLSPGVPLINPQKGVMMMIVGIPNRKTVEVMLGDKMPWWFGPLLDLMQWYYKWLFWGTKIQYEMVSASPDIREDLEKVGEMFALGKIKPVWTVVEFRDLEAVKTECEKVHSGKGGLGKLIVRIDESKTSSTHP